MNKSAIEDIVKRVYPQIVKDLGRAKKGTPKVEVHNNVLAMHSGISDHPGGEKEHAEYDYKTNTIYLFKVALKSEQLVIQALLHEYTHATQDPKKNAEYRKLGYRKDPYEKAAHRAESTWRKYMKKNENINEAIELPADKTVVLQAGTDEHKRGLVVTWLSDGGYDVAYWYGTPDNIVSAELKGDGKSFGDIKNVWLGYHPKLDEGAKADRWFDNLKYYYEKGLKSPDLKDPAEKKSYTKQAKQFFSKLREIVNMIESEDEITERLKKGESGCCHACGWSHVKGAAHKKPYKTGKNSCANRKTEQITEDCGCGGKKRKDASLAIAEYLKEQEITEADYQGRDVKLNKPMQGDVKKFKVYVKNAKGNVVKVNFGQKGMVIKKDNPAAKKSFRARHKCDQSKPKTSPGYWSCKKW